MKARIKNLSEEELLRKKAEELFSKQESKLRVDESEILKLNHELSIHQIELELQNNELIRAKEELEEAIQKYTDLYDFAPTGYLTLSRERQIIRLNLSASKMLGKERQNLIKNTFNLYVKDDTKVSFNYFINEIFNSHTGQNCEITLLNQNGITLMNVYLVGVISKNTEYCDISMIDITERKLAEVNLKAVNKELEQSIGDNADKELFISLLAHDLRNPFGVLLGYTELLLGGLHSHDRAYLEKLILEIYNSAQNSYSLLEDLLKWSRIRNGRYPFELQKISFKKICSDVVNLFSPLASAKKILINCSDDKGISLLADGDMLKAVLRNLVANAIKYTNLNGIIKISAEPIDSNVLFSVSDNGTGIERERIEHLFEITHSSTPGTANEKGTGLGLLICKEFVEKHGGKIWVKSEEGKGSVFYFNIPSKSEGSVNNLISEGTEEDDHINNLKILIADDDAALSMILGTMVTNYSKEILYAHDGAEAVEICKNNPDIDLILMDYYMPIMNGYEATKLIRTFNRNVIIIIETANEITDITERLPREGISDFFFKPYSRIFLNELILKYFKNKNIAVL
jgi:PAS domain S-box-containing protein